MRVYQLHSIANRGMRFNGEHSISIYGHLDYGNVYRGLKGLDKDEEYQFIAEVGGTEINIIGTVDKFFAEYLAAYPQKYFWTHQLINKELVENPTPHIPATISVEDMMSWI